MAVLGGRSTSGTASVKQKSTIRQAEAANTAILVLLAPLYLLREVNPYDTGAKLGAETLMHIMKTTGNVTPLEKMALEMGYRLEPAEGMGSTVRA